jgi:PAS domain S-box-containing protein
MKDKDKTKEQILNELAKSRRRIAEFEKLETEHKRIKEALQDSEEKYRNIVELDPDGIIAIDLKGFITSCNTAFLNLSGFTKKEIIGKHFTKLPTLHIKDISKYTRMFNSLLKGKVPKPLKIPSRHKNGQTRWGELRFCLMKKGRKIMGIQGIVRDITERKQADKELQIKDLAIKSAIGAIAFADLEGKLTYVNDSFLKLWGYDDQKEVLGKPSVKFWQTEEEAMEVVKALRNRGSWIGELVAIKKDGSTFDAQLSASTVTDETGKPICLMASFIDITERQMAEGALRESEKNYR